MRPEAEPARPAALGAEILHRLRDVIPPASGAVVMGTGIVSVALLLDGRHLLSTILLVIDAVIWLALAVLLPTRARRDRQRFLIDLRHPTALTSIAGTEVLGTRLTLAGWNWAGAGLLIMGTAIWFGLVPNVLRHWQTPTIGASFILTVATESLALLAATVAIADGAGWLVYAALVPFCLGLIFYGSCSAGSISASCWSEPAITGSRAARWRSQPLPLGGSHSPRGERARCPQTTRRSRRSRCCSGA